MEIPREVTPLPSPIGWAGLVQTIHFFDGGTQREIGLKAGVGQQTIARWEKGFSPNRHHKRAAAVGFSLTKEAVEQLDEGTYVSLPFDPRHFANMAKPDQGTLHPFEQERHLRNIVGAFTVRIQNGPPLNVDEITLLRDLMGQGHQEQD